MTNKEKYKQAFSGLHASIDVRMEDIMKKKSANNQKNRCGSGGISHRFCRK